MTCKHLMRDTADCVFCERDLLRGELTMAEEGLGKATQEIENAKHDIERLMTAASAEATQAERLRNALFRHACYCGCGDPNPDLHREDCAYRVACAPGTT